MALFLTRFTHTTDTWRRMVQQPENRVEAVRHAVEAVGGELHGVWYAFGQDDGYILAEYPDSVAAAAFIAAAAAGGADRTLETIHLISPDDMVAALRRAQGVMFRQPGG